MGHRSAYKVLGQILQGLFIYLLFRELDVMATKSKGSSQPKRGFAFDLNKPLFKGNLLKQGEFHRAFKDRFFVLYPGFLVYYDDISTWKYDLQRGETLGVSMQEEMIQNDPAIVEIEVNFHNCLPFVGTLKRCKAERRVCRETKESSQRS